jgi:integrase
MRQGEIGRVERRHVRFDRATVLVYKTKNGSPRTVPLWTSTVRMLNALKSEREDGLLFGPGSAIAQVFKIVVKRAGIENLRFHELRHEGTLRLFENTDLSDMEIASITGHKTLSMLKRYTHLRADRLAVKLARAERSLDIGPATIHPASSTMQSEESQQLLA